MSIRFRTIRWKNFLRTGNDWIEISLGEGGTTLVIGKNGSGKSTVLDALAFVLFNRPFRKVSKSQLINSITRKELVVEAGWSSDGRDYRVVRGMRPNIFEVYQDGKLLNPDASDKDYQEVLEKQILQFNFKSFSQVIVLGSASYLPFMKLPAATRREVVEDLLDLQIFSIMNLLLKRRVDADAGELERVTVALTNVDEKIRLIENGVAALERAGEKMIHEKRDRIAATGVEIEGLRAGITQLTLEISKLGYVDTSELERKRRRLEELRAQITTKVERIRKEQRFFREHDQCPTCLQGIAADHKAEMVRSRDGSLGELNDGLDNLEREVNVVADTIRMALTRNEEVRSRETERKNRVYKVVSLEKYVEDLEREIKSIEEGSREEIDVEQLGKLHGQNLALQERTAELAREQELNRAAQGLLKDSGIKSRIVKQYIPIINRLINKYLAAMEEPVNFELNEHFEERILSRHRDEFTYNSFSEGEKFKINLAILFAWRALAKLRNSVDTNLLIMDETLDASLDDDGVESFLRLIGELGGENSIFVITHKTDQMLDKFSRGIKFKKHKNFSLMEEI